MNRRMRQWMLRLLVVAAMAVAVPFQSMAATAKIAFSDPSAKVGDEVSVTMKFTSTSGDALGNTDVMLSYDATMLDYINETENASGGNGAIRVWSAPDGGTEAVTVLRFKALRGGTAEIKVSSWEGYDNNGQALTVEREGSSKVTIQGLATSSSDATLKSLQISPGTLTPAFTPLTDSYTTTVGLDTDKLTVSASANSSGATVAVQGGNELQEGMNTVICRVTAEDGTTVKEYTISVNKTAETGAEEPTETTQPEVLAMLDVTAKKIRIIALPDGVEAPTGFKESSVAIGEAKVTGWIPADEEPQYCLLYGMNDDGEQNFYRFDLKERTVQRYFGDLSHSEYTDEDYISLATEYNSLSDDYSLCRLLMFGFIALTVLLAVVLIVVLVRRPSRPASGGRSRGRQDEMPSQRSGESGRAQHREARGAGGRRLSREERYMMGEEEDYEEDDDFEAEAYQPETAGSASYEPETYDEPETYEEPQRYSEPGRYEEPVSYGRTSAQAAETDVERGLEADLARGAAAAAKEPDDDDFEFVDLDD